MASITTLLENNVIADLQTDAFIGQFPILPHDFDALKSFDTATGTEHPFVIVVTAYDMGDYDHTFGAGIRKLQLEVQINANVLATDYATTLDTLDERISGWLQPSSTLPVTGREDALSSFELKVFGILSSGAAGVAETLRHDLGLVRQRVIQRIFVAAKIG